MIGYQTNRILQHCICYSSKYLISAQFLLTGIKRVYPENPTFQHCICYSFKYLLSAQFLHTGIERLYPGNRTFQHCISYSCKYRISAQFLSSGDTWLHPQKLLGRILRKTLEFFPPQFVIFQISYFRAFLALVMPRECIQDTEEEFTIILFISLNIFFLHSSCLGIPVLLIQLTERFNVLFVFFSKYHFLSSSYLVIPAMCIQKTEISNVIFVV